MQNCSRALLAIPVAIGTLASACASEETDRDGSLHCSPEQLCRVEGTLELASPGFPAAGARVITAKGCVLVLLSDTYADWDGAQVTFSGLAHVQPFHPNVSSWTYRERRGVAAWCESKFYIYQEEIVRLDKAG
jgi:hypothetical protein